MRAGLRDLRPEGGRIPFLMWQAPVAPLRGGEKRLHAVVVGLGDAIIFVVMAAGAADGEAKKDGACGVRGVVQVVLPPLRMVGAEFVPRAEANITGRGESIGIVGIELIAGQLLLDEPVVGFVGV